MGQEIELKLSIEPEDVERLINHSLLRKFSTGPPQKKHLTSFYFDTPDYDLRMHGMSLRIRFDGEKYIQTLKKGGGGRKGLTVRGEWEWPVDGYQIDLKWMTPDICPPELCNRLNQLAPVFQTDFDRTIRTLQINAGELFETPAMVEMALDSGNVIAHTAKGVFNEIILEMELEILEGDPEILFRISNLLEKDIRLNASNVSKARRGYRLLTGH